MIISAVSLASYGYTRKQCIERRRVMVRTPFAVEPGWFINTSETEWSLAPSTTMGITTVKRTAEGISVTASTGSLFLPTVGNNTSRYKFFGSNNYLLVLQSMSEPGSAQCSVTLINFTTPSLSSVFILSVDSITSVPHVQYSKGSGSAFLIYTPTHFGIAGTAIYRSDNGALLCAGPASFNATGQTLGEATNTEVKIHYSTDGQNQTQSCRLPKTDISPSQEEIL